MWTIRKTIKKGDYLYAIVPEHPKATKHGYVLEHRIVMENMINRMLTEHEQVHHIDGNRHNNLPENLMLMNRSEHQRMHKLQYPNGHFIDLICEECGKHFRRSYKNRPEIKNQQRIHCSRKCNGKRFMRVYRSGLLNQKP